MLLFFKWSQDREFSCFEIIIFLFKFLSNNDNFKFLWLSENFKMLNSNGSV